ncbi:MAG: RHS repeat-associated core domain-containing protein, partial [Candidatus Kariarchaeaceae archaeon]
IETNYSYDDSDNLLTLTDANGNITQFQYDRNNRLVKEIRPMGEENTYQYDGVGNLIQKIDAKNQKTEYVYDDAGRLVEVRYFNATDHVNAVKTVLFAYDKVGNLKAYDDGTTSALYTYDAAYRKVSESVDYGSFTLNYWYTYYKNGMKKSFTGPDGITYDYTYDSNNQLTAVQIPGQGSITYTSYNWNRPSNISLPGGSTKEYVYDPLMRIKTITSKDPGQNALLNYQYTYDKMDNITAKDTEHGDYDYSYDDLYRLTTVHNPTLDDEAFTYDQVGNRLTTADIAGNWTYNNNNELEGYDNISYVYDDNGNMAQKTDNGVITNYIYNEEDRLTEVRDGQDSLIAECYYDPFGRRLWKEVGGTITYFLYADEGLVGEYDSSGSEIKTYAYVPASTWTTDPLFMKIDTNYYFYHNDHLGTPQKMTAINGAVVWRVKYSSFGQATIEPISTVTNNLRFPGQYYDNETGLNYNRFRYYEPKLGRYTRSDPVGLKGGLNLYLYSLNSPLVFFDNEGLAIIAWCSYFSFGGGLGAGSLECNLENLECINGLRQKGDYHGIFGGVTLGSPLGLSFFSVTFNNVSNVENLAGKATIVTITVTVIAGPSSGQICLGHGCTDFPDEGVSLALGADISFDLFIGWGKVDNVIYECCDEESDGFPAPIIGEPSRFGK